MSAGQILFYIGSFWLIYVYAGYPVALWLWGLFNRIRVNADDEHEPSVAVLIAARNEEKDIRWKMKETLAWHYPAEKLELLVASDASEDRTDEILGSVADNRLRWVRMEPRGGKVRALNTLATMARGEILFFTDANAHIGPECLRRMVRHFADPRVGCVTGDSYVMTDDSAISDGSGAYWGLEILTKRLENRIGSVLVCDGAVFSLRRELYGACSPDLANDLELPLVAGKQGYWILHEPDAKVFERDTPSIAQEFERRRRICSQGMLGMWMLRDSLRGVRLWQFLSHKFLRWLTLLPMMMVFIGSALSVREPLFALAFIAQLLFYMAALGAVLRNHLEMPSARFLSIPLYIVVGAAAALTGVIDTLLGKRFATWNIPTLSRGTGGRAA